MALTRKIFTSAATEEFATTLQEAIENLGLFDSVTRTGTVVSCIKDSITVLMLNGAASNSNFKEITNYRGTQLTYSLVPSGANLASYGTIVSNDDFVYLIVTDNMGSTRTTQSCETIIVCKTKNNDIGIINYGAYNYTHETYPFSFAQTCTYHSQAMQTAGGSQDPVILPKSFSWGCIETYPFTTLLEDSTHDVCDGVYGVICAPSLFTLSRSETGVSPPIVILDGKQYLTDGGVLIEIK